MEIEVQARSEEVTLNAYSMLAAIGEAFGSKGSIKKLGKAMGGGIRAGDTSEIAELRRRLAPMVAGGMVKVKQ